MKVDDNFFHKKGIRGCVIDGYGKIETMDGNSPEYARWGILEKYI